MLDRRLPLGRRRPDRRIDVRYGGDRLRAARGIGLLRATVRLRRARIAEILRRRRRHRRAVLAVPVTVFVVKVLLPPSLFVSVSEPPVVRPLLLCDVDASVNVSLFFSA